MKKTTATIAAFALAATLAACGTAEPSPVTTTAPTPTASQTTESAEEAFARVDKANREQAEAQKKAEDAAIEQSKKNLEKLEADLAARNAAAIPEEGEAALQAAQQYLEFSGFSEKGLRDQLKFEKFPAKAIDYAMKNVNADYNAEAVETAKTYLEMGGMSKASLRDQLAFEGYSKAQINHAMKNV